MRRRLPVILLLSVAAGRLLAAPSVVEASVVPGCLEGVSPDDAHVRIRASKDTRVSLNHPESNDGGAGLMRIKRGQPVRSLVGFDLSCLHTEAPSALAGLSCATLELSVYRGRASRTRPAIFHAHRLTVPWDEGDEAWNLLRTRRSQLGPHPGTVPGVTWACRHDLDTAWPSVTDCAPEDLWNGGDAGDVCGAGPCYDSYGGAPPTAEYVGRIQPRVAWDVTDDVRSHDPTTAIDHLSWILKVADEELRGGSVRVFTREGAAHRAAFDPEPDAGMHFDLAPTLDLYGAGLPTLAIDSLAPTAPVSAATACVSFSEAGGVTSARWENLTTGEWGWMDEGGCGAGWSATVPLSTDPADQPNRLEITVADRCAQEAVFEHAVAHEP